MSITDRLDEIQARADHATDGPWEASEEIDGYRAGRRTMILAGGGLDVRRRVVTVDQVRPHHEPAEPNIEFIAHARTDVPALVAALQAVLDLHRPNTLGSLTTCAKCRNLYGSLVDYPCSTVRAVEAALGEVAP